jgi:hypothetical protein
LNYVSCGGKTGTAKKFVQGIGYSTSTYVSSFVGFFPVENPEYLIFIKIDSPKNGYYGGEIAAPVFKRIGDRIWELKQSILRQVSQISENKNSPTDENQFPDLTGKSKLSAIEIAKSFGAKIELKGNGDVIHNQIYDRFKNKVTLFLNDDSSLTKDNSKVYMPNVIGLSLREASTKLKSSGIQFVVDGTGYVVNQSVEPGKYVNPSVVVKLICQRGS